MPREAAREIIGLAKEKGLKPAAVGKTRLKIGPTKLAISVENLRDHAVELAKKRNLVIEWSMVQHRSPTRPRMASLDLRFKRK